MVQPRRFTREEDHRLLEAGVIPQGERVEPITGSMREMSPTGSRHPALVKTPNAPFHQALGEQALEGVQDPLRLSPLSQPPPDLVPLKVRPDFYAQDHPSLEDLLLPGEMAEASSAYDRQVKLPPYVRTGVPKVWLVTLEENQEKAYRKPLEGACPGVGKPGPEEALAPLAFPQVFFAVREILP